MYQSLSDVQKKRFFNSLMAVIILLAVFLGAKAIGSLKEIGFIGRDVYPSNVIAVNGKGEVLAIPDIGSFSFSVTEEGKTVQISQDASAKKINTIIDAVKALGVDDKDIKTTSYNSYPKYDYSSGVCAPQRYDGPVTDAVMPIYCPPSKQVLTGYETSQTISVKVRKSADSGAVLTKVGSLGATNISALDFIIDDVEKVQGEARAKAIADAKEKAKVLAKSLGVRLVKIVNFNESGNYPIPYYGYGGTMMKDAMVENQASVPPQLPVGENEIVSNVTITYEVE